MTITIKKRNLRKNIEIFSKKEEEIEMKELIFIYLTNYLRNNEKKRKNEREKSSI